MEWEISGRPHPLPTAPLHTDSLLERQWMDLEQRFQRFEHSFPDWTLPLEVDFSGGLPVPDAHCSSFNYLDDPILSLYDDVVFPDFQMFPALPPLDLCNRDHEIDLCQQGYGTNIRDKKQRSVQIVVAEDDKIDAGKELSSVSSGGSISQIRAKSVARTKSDELHFGDLQKYFDRPILEAAKELKVGLTLLKKRCRKLGIRRWPHRKLRSLKYLINNVKELGLEQELKMLEEQRKMLVNQPEMELNDRANKIRQKSFKANHMRRRKMGVVCLNN